jgi:hypothetical protein
LCAFVLVVKVMGNSKSIREIGMKLQSNLFTANDTDHLYLGGSHFNHSCVFNCVYQIFTETGELQIRTVVDVRKGDELTIPYLNVVGKTEERREKLLQQLGIQCACVACLNNQNTFDWNHKIAKSLQSGICSGCFAPPKTAMKVCKGCGINRYCSVDCQRRSWPQHKLTCNRYDRVNASISSTNTVATTAAAAASTNSHS